MGGSTINKSSEFKNVINGNVLTVETKDCIIQGGGCLTAAVGMEDVIVVDADDAS